MNQVNDRDTEAAASAHIIHSPRTPHSTQSQRFLFIPLSIVMTDMRWLICVQCCCTARAAGRAWNAGAAEPDVGSDGG